MIEWEEGIDPDRRIMTRRSSDKVCPYHDIEFGISCPAVNIGKNDIKNIQGNMVKKEDLVDVKDDIKTLFKEKAPRWVVVTMITTAVPIMIALMVWIGSRLGIISTVAANQKIIMQAFNIEAVAKDFDSKE